MQTFYQMNKICTFVFQRYLKANYQLFILLSTLPHLSLHKDQIAFWWKPIFSHQLFSCLLITPDVSVVDSESDEMIERGTLLFLYSVKFYTPKNMPLAVILVPVLVLLSCLKKSLGYENPTIDLTDDKSNSFWDPCFLIQ